MVCTPPAITTSLTPAMIAWAAKCPPAGMSRTGDRWWCRAPRRTGRRPASRCGRYLPPAGRWRPGSQTSRRRNPRRECCCARRCACSTCARDRRHAPRRGRRGVAGGAAYCIYDIGFCHGSFLCLGVGNPCTGRNPRTLYGIPAVPFRQICVPAHRRRVPFENIGGDTRLVNSRVTPGIRQGPGFFIKYAGPPPRYSPWRRAPGYCFRRQVGGLTGPSVWRGIRRGATSRSPLATL